MHGFDGQTTEQNMVDFVKTTTEHKLPVDYLWIDAGWYESTPPNQWVWTGTWIPDAKRFPNGLGPVGKAAHEHGLKFILWFEPERVMKNSWLHKNYPDWILAPSADIPDDQRYQLNDGFYLLNLGNPQALAWTKATFSNMIRDFGVDIYRQDFNIHPLPHWRNGEPEDRQGINEIKHIMGMYDFWDTLINQFPDILIDNCASGGRRLDLETTRRSLPLFRSDECWKPIPEQCMNMGLSLWLPYHGMGSISLDPYHFWSGIGTNFTVSLNNNDPSVWEPATKLLNQYRIIQTLLYGDFYPLTDYSLEENVWMVWQYHRDNSGQGLIMAFRRPKSEVDTMTFQLQGLSPQTKYSLTNMDSNETIILTGSDLMQKGLPLTVPSPAGVILLTYQKTE
jgi:alpha-galactosidase